MRRHGSEREVLGAGSAFPGVGGREARGLEVGTQHLHLRSRFSACHRSHWETRLKAWQLSALLPSNVFHLELDLCRLSSFLPARCPLPSPPCRGCSSLKFYSEPGGLRGSVISLQPWRAHRVEVTLRSLHAAVLCVEGWSWAGPL